MAASTPNLTIRLLGPLQILRDGQPVQVPSSRKARAILGYLALAQRPVTRQRLCDLFFDMPDDPRASLRWTLTKLRAVVDDPDAPRIQSARDTLSFDPAGARIDALDMLSGRADLDTPVHADAFLEDAELPDRTDFSLWLQSTRETLRAAHAAALRGALAQADAEQRLAFARQLQAIEPLDETGHAHAVEALVALGRPDAAREAATEAERVLRRAGKRPTASLRGALTPKAAAAPVAIDTPRVAGAVFDMLPCVAIVPFNNFSPDLIADELMEGLRESVTDLFSRFRTFRVLPSAAPGAKAHMQTPDALHAAGADFVIGGSVLARSGASKLRYRIVDAKTGALLSSGDVDAAAVSPATMVEQLPGALVPHLVHQCMDLIRTRATLTPEAQRTEVDHYLCAMSDAYFIPAPSYARALVSAQKALSMRPDYPAAMAIAAHCKALMGVARTEPARSDTHAQALAAIATGNDDAFTLSIGAWSIVHVAGDVDPALRAVDLAIRLNPLGRMAWTVSGWIRAMNGEFETPMAHWEQAERCSPLGASYDLINSGRALCCWMAGEYAQSLQWARRSLERVPSNPGALTAGVAAAARLGDRLALSDMSARLLQHYPAGADDKWISAAPILNPALKEAMLAAVRDGLATA